MDGRHNQPQTNNSKYHGQTSLNSTSNLHGNGERSSAAKLGLLVGGANKKKINTTLIRNHGGSSTSRAGGAQSTMAGSNNLINK